MAINIGEPTEDGASVPVRVLVLEDSQPLLDRFARIIETWPQGQLSGAVSSVAAARRIIETNPIDILVADLNLPDGNGIEAISALRVSQPEAHAVVISVLSDGATVLKAIQAGACGYVLKDDTSIDFINALSMMREGKSPMSAAIARQIIENLQTVTTDVPVQEHLVEESTASLTPREQEVLTAIARGFTYREVADILNISAQTVPVHVRNIYRKLDAGNRSEAVYEATRQGLIEI